MNKLVSLLLVATVLFSCKGKEEQTNVSTDNAGEPSSFFPVTSYLKGQIKELKTAGVNPLKITVAGGKTDSAWLKLEALDSMLKVFTTPEIDSNNMSPYFAESRFLDQTLNAFTFTYEPKKALPKDMMVKRWDIYVTPETGYVKRIYIEKYGEQLQDLQLTWQSNAFCKIVYLKPGANGGGIEKEELIKWKFEEE
ncbi:MAG: hypothetical protein EOO06_03030 [Chitinophagaceae bacterium]|nr:MAG: hypothetical protein EOO06_03030 [Chitinophagaceae bacterium]